MIHIHCYNGEWVCMSVHCRWTCHIKRRCRWHVWWVCKAFPNHCIEMCGGVAFCELWKSLWWKLYYKHNGGHMEASVRSLGRTRDPRAQAFVRKVHLSFRRAQWQSVPTCCWDWASQVASTLLYAGQPRFVKTKTKRPMDICIPVVCVCVRVRGFAPSCEEERAKKVLGEGGGKKGPGEDEREWAWKEKEESTKEREHRALASRHRRESAQGGKRKEKENLNSRHSPSLHTLTHACKHYSCFSPRLHCVVGNLTNSTSFPPNVFDEIWF